MKIRIRESQRYQPVSVPIQADGWLAPTGEFYHCGYGEHDRCALEITGLHDVDLENAGWLHISDREIRNWNVPPTQAQMDTLWDMMKIFPRTKLGVDIQEYFNTHCGKGE